MMRRERFTTYGANVVLGKSDVGRTVLFTKGSAGTVTIPRMSTVEIPIGSQIVVVQMGAGQATITAGSGVTLRASGGKVKTAAQYAVVRLLKVASDEWVVTGDAST